MTRKCLKKKETPACLENLTLSKNFLFPEVKNVGLYPMAVWRRSQMFLPLYQLPLFLAPAGMVRNDLSKNLALLLLKCVIFPVKGEHKEHLLT